MLDFHALLLGIVQGITEFFPVSSSTHLYFVKKLMGITHSGGMLIFDLFCHLGTLLALLISLRADILRLFSSFRAMGLMALALFPLIPSYLIFKPLRIILADSSPLFLMGTSLLLFAALKKNRGGCGPKWRDMLCIGMAQSLALLPGISRSGSTIAIARLLGWRWEEAARFSFLLAIPAVFGGTALELLHIHKVQVPWRACGIGFSVSFLVGWGALRLLFRWLSPRMMRIFAWYCLAAGLISFVAL